jgi:3-mercaptopyruvate sulfurtransferase SseA
MKHIPKIIVVLIIGLLFAAALQAPAAEKEKNEPYTVVTSEDLKAMLDHEEPGLEIIDARNPVEFQEVHIRSAINIPWPKLEKDKTLLTFPKEAKIVFYCNGFK